MREVREETGYVDIEYKRTLGGPVRADYFAKHKDEIKEHITAEHERMHAALKAHITATLEGTKGDDPSNYPGYTGGAGGAD